MASTKGKQNYINHIALVLDMSGSMSGHTDAMIEVVDNQIKFLAESSLELDQETRVTVYVFDSVIECVFYDKDVLRLPSIKEHYKPRGTTRLIDASLKAMDDLAKLPELYGDHAFLTLVFTDGYETQRRYDGPPELKKRINSLPGNWTTAVMVPDDRARQEARGMGFPADNIAVWDTSKGVGKAGETMRAATTAYLTGRASGVRSTNSFFSMGADVVNAETIKAAGLKPVTKGTFKFVVVPPAMHDYQIRDFVQGAGLPFQVYNNFYQLMKPEKIQGDKVLAIVHKKTREVFLGDKVRQMVGLPDYETTVRPEANKEYDIFVQSGSVNRKVKVGQQFLVTGLVNTL